MEIYLVTLNFISLFLYPLYIEYVIVDIVYLSIIPRTMLFFKKSKHYLGIDREKIS